MTPPEPAQPPSSPAAPGPAQDESRAAWLLAAGRIRVIGLVGTAVVLGLLAQHRLVDDRKLGPGLMVWGLAIVVFLAALWFAWRLPTVTAATHPAEAPKPPLPRLVEAALFAVVLGVGIFFRFYRIGDIPPGLNHDAAWNGLYAITITQGRHYAPFVNCCGAVGHETMFHYVVAAFQFIVGPTAFAIQLASLSIGIATLGIFYLLIRRMFDIRVALVSTLLLGVSGWHITFSRAGWHAILVPLFEALVFYLLLRAIDSRRIRDFLLAGIAVGLSLDTYDAAKTIPLSVAAFVLYLVARNRSMIRTYSIQFLGYGVAALAAVAPLGWYALHHWDAYFGRSRSLWIGDQIKAAGNLGPLWRNLGDGLLVFNFRAHGDDFFVREPLLDVPVSVFFILGLAYSLTRLKRPEHFLLLTMLVASMTNGFLSEPNGNRGLGAVLPVAAYAGLFVVVAWRWLEGAFPHVVRLGRLHYIFPRVARSSWLQGALPGRAPLFGLGLAAVLLVTAYLTFDSYLGPDRRTQWGFYPETTHVGRYVKTIAPDYEVHLAAGNWPRDALTYLSYQGSGDPFKRVYTYTQDAAEFLGMAPAEKKGTAFIIEAVPNNQGVVDELRRRYPDAEVDEIHYPDGSDKTIAFALLVPPGATPKPPEEDEEAYATPGGAERDQQRRKALMLITAALVDYQNETGSFPDTGGSVQTACAYLDLDKLCVLRDEVGIETLVDPRGDVHQYGYWYQSNGKSFVLYASFENPVLPNEACTADDPELARKPHLVCVRVENP